MTQQGAAKKLTATEKFHLKHFVKELIGYKGRHTELVSVYVPAGYDLNAIINHLQEEQGTAGNIKSKQTKTNVQDALERMIQYLRGVARTPTNGLAAFSGNVAETEGRSDVRVWGVEPPVPLNQRLYRCDKEFILEPLQVMLADDSVYGLVVMDRRDAMIGLLKGKTIVPIRKTHSEVPGKMRAGGQCLVKGSLVQSADGQLLKIEECHNPIIVKSMHGNTLIDSPITEKWTTQKNVVYKIITKYPRYAIECSADHHFFISTAAGIVEKPAETLVEEDKLLFPERITVVGTIQQFAIKKYYNRFTLTARGRTLLTEARERKGLLQRELAKKLGWTQTGVSFYEIGKNRIDPTRLELLCKALDLDYEPFLEQHAVPFLSHNVRLPAALNADLAQFLGYYLGDGNVETDRVTLSEQEKEVASSYQRLAKHLFGLKPSYRFRADKHYHQVRLTSRPLVRFLRQEFSEIAMARPSSIPPAILKSPDKVLAAFLKGLFDAEGYVAHGRSLGLSVNNEDLARQLQLVLLRFSIIASLYEYDNRRNQYSDNPRFTVDVTEQESLKHFQRSIGFTSKRKQRLLAALIKTKAENSRVRQVLVSGKLIRNIIERAGYNCQLFPKVNNFFRDERMMSKAAFRRSVLPHIPEKNLREQLTMICDAPLLPVKIAAIIRKKKRVEMVDLTVKNQSFIANGLIVHNSSVRFARLREGATKDHYKKIADHMKDEFLPMQELKGIIIGGPSTTVNDFMNHDYVTGDVKKKIIGTKDLSYTGEFGLQELLEKSEDLLAEEEVADEKKIMRKFFEHLAKDTGLVAYGKEHVKQTIQMGAADIILLSETLEDEEISEFEQAAKPFGSTVRIVSTETREGVQLNEMGKIAAILRYPVAF